MNNQEVKDKIKYICDKCVSEDNCSNNCWGAWVTEDGEAYCDEDCKFEMEISILAQIYNEEDL